MSGDGKRRENGWSGCQRAGKGLARDGIEMRSEIEEGREGRREWRTREGREGRARRRAHLLLPRVAGLVTKRDKIDINFRVQMCIDDDTNLRRRP